MTKRALISVSDKSGVVEFARTLSALGYEIISSGGTAKTLMQNAIECKEICDITGFPEILDGRVKTLQPKIHGGILAKRNNITHLQEMKKYEIEPIDIVAVNLYPFEETITELARHGTTGITDEVIENIDIGGVALIRAAAKNFTDVLIVTSPADYAILIEKLVAGTINTETRQALAAKAFRHTAYYDSLISNYFTREKFPETMTIPLKKTSALRYGENPHQEAALYDNRSQQNVPCVVNAKILQGKELSYNNYLDLDAAWRLILEFTEPTCAIIKHNNPCGCASSTSIIDAYQRALACDPVSAFGGIIAVNREIGENEAIEITKLFTECIIAPSYSAKAKEIFSTKKNLRILEQPAMKKSDRPTDIEVRALTGGMLVQDKDNALLNETNTMTVRPPSMQEMDSLIFAWTLCKHVKSNAIILVRGCQTVGVGAGQMSRIDSLNIAAQKMKSVHHGLDEKQIPLVLASDAFFPFNDVVNEAAKIGVSAIIQPGGSIRDGDSVKAANAQNMSMVMTGMRHFKH
ncbi:MAG: bifunctional phosphoribosylaminoimidazolecarboxamide formyltransferase/IMP cyclohydrolase [Endomicrobiales bacterium]